MWLNFFINLLSTITHVFDSLMTIKSYYNSLGLVKNFNDCILENRYLLDNVFFNIFFDMWVYTVDFSFLFFYNIWFLVPFYLLNSFLYLYLNSNLYSVTKLFVREIFMFVYSFIKEIEKELFNLDDVLLSLIAIFLTLGWIFFLTFMPVSVFSNPFAFTVLIIFFMNFLSFSTTVFLVYDQGSNFLTYLRGVGSSTVFILELIYDFIAIFTLCIRVVIQNLRFFFIFIGFIEMQEFIANFTLTFEGLPLYDTSSSYEATFLYSQINTKLFIINKFVYNIVLLYYYIIHFWILCVSNTISYFFLIYWLYLFFYTSFSSEKMEAYFKR